MAVPQVTRQTAGSEQLVTVHPVLGQVTEQPSGGHATSHDCEDWHDTEQVLAEAQSTPHDAAPEQSTRHAAPASHVLSQD